MCMSTHKTWQSDITNAIIFIPFNYFFIKVLAQSVMLVGSIMLCWNILKMCVEFSVISKEKVLM